MIFLILPREPGQYFFIGVKSLGGFMGKVKEGDAGWCNNPDSYHYAAKPDITVTAGFKEECGRSCIDCPYFVKKTS